MNPDFQPGTFLAFLAGADPTDGLWAGTLLDSEHLASQSPDAHITPWTYIQLRHFFQTSAHTTKMSWPLTPFEHICSKADPQQHVISTVYGLLGEHTPLNTDKACRAWERDLAVDISLEGWECIFHVIHKGLVNVSTQETNYKRMSRWYRTPALIHKFDPTCPNRCWRCQQEVGTLLHVWWECPLLQPFWTAVHSTTLQVTTDTLEYSPAQYLLHYTSPPF